MVGDKMQTTDYQLMMFTGDAVKKLPVLTGVVDGLLAVSVDEQFQGGEASDVELFSQLFLLGGVHFGQTERRLLLLQHPSSLGVNRLQLFTVTTPRSIYSTNEHTHTHKYNESQRDTEEVKGFNHSSSCADTHGNEVLIDKWQLGSVFLPLASFPSPGLSVRSTQFICGRVEPVQHLDRTGHMCDNASELLRSRKENLDETYLL